MGEDRTGQVAIVFVSERTPGDDAAYAQAAAAMDALAAAQPGYRGIDSARGADGVGITVSYWADEASAVAWREHPAHAEMRERGRRDWYARYDVAVATIDRSYAWRRS